MKEHRYVVGHDLGGELAVKIVTARDALQAAEVGRAELASKVLWVAGPFSDRVRPCFSEYESTWAEWANHVEEVVTPNYKIGPRVKV